MSSTTRLLEPIEHFRRLLTGHLWNDAWVCFIRHRDDIARLNPRRKAELLSLMYGRRESNDWECNVPLLVQMLQLDAPVERDTIQEAFGLYLFGTVLTIQGDEMVSRPEGDIRTPLKIQVLRLLSEQMERVGILLSTGQQPIREVTTQVFARTFLNFGTVTAPDQTHLPLRFQLIDLIVRTFRISFNEGSHRVWMNRQLEQAPIEFIRFFATNGWLKWSVMATLQAGEPDLFITREEWVIRERLAQPGDERLEQIYRLMMDAKMTALASGSHSRLGSRSPFGQLPKGRLDDAVMGRVASMLSGKNH